MSGKSPFISEKISELRQKIARPCTAFETGGFRPAGDDRENWIGRYLRKCRRPPADA